jgi:two-component system cell cycle response regulator
MSGRCNVLVVDDDELIRKQLVIHLERAGYAVATADCAQRALGKLAESRCEVVIADWEMPDMDGVSLCRRIRDERGENYVYVLMFTIRDNSDDVLTGLEAGADAYVVKGTPMTELIARLESFRRVIASRARSQPDRLRRLEWLSNVYPAASRPTAPQRLPNLAVALAREYARCRARSAPISLLLCAPDDLAGLNERMGTEVSAAFLEGLRAEVPKHLLESEWVARCGCEGFLVVLPDTVSQAAQLVADKVRGAIASAGATVAIGSEPIAATVSIGLAAVDDGRHLQNMRPVELLRASEQCLAQSRREGGNRITGALLEPLNARQRREAPQG